jgi:hypothetical protein
MRCSRGLSERNPGAICQLLFSRVRDRRVVDEQVEAAKLLADAFRRDSN